VFRWSTIATIALVSAYTLASIIIGIVPCRGADSFIWPRPNSSSCVNVLQVFLAFSPTNILSDLLILFLPIPVIVHHLRLPKRQKFAIFITLGFSGFLVFLDITRIVLLQQSLNSHGEQTDYTYTAARPIMIMVVWYPSCNSTPTLLSITIDQRQSICRSCLCASTEPTRYALRTSAA